MAWRFSPCVVLLPEMVIMAGMKDSGGMAKIILVFPGQPEHNQENISSR
jgi:hypothetical protein